MKNQKWWIIARALLLHKIIFSANVEKDHEIAIWNFHEWYCQPQRWQNATSHEPSTWKEINKIAGIFCFVIEWFCTHCSCLHRKKFRWRKHNYQLGCKYWFPWKDCRKISENGENFEKNSTKRCAVCRLLKLRIFFDNWQAMQHLKISMDFFAKLYF